MRKTNYDRELRSREEGISDDVRFGKRAYKSQTSTAGLINMSIPNGLKVTGRRNQITAQN